MRKSLGLLVFLSTTVAGGAVPGIPDVRFSGSRVTGIPAINHKVRSQEMRVLETEDCQAHPRSRNVVEISSRCGYVRGIFHYRYVPEGSDKAVDLYMGFGLSRKGNGKHTFLVSAPLRFTAE